MTAIALYVPESRELDLSALSAADFEMVKGLRGLIHRGDNILLCKRARGDRELHVFKYGGNYFARHFAGGAHGKHRISRISDEHLRGTDCWMQAWSDAGYRTASEVSTDNNVRLDAVAFAADNVTFLETQVTPQPAASVKGRHTKRLRARALTGAHERQLAKPLQGIWFDPIGAADWSYQVPTVQCANRSWETTPHPATVTAIGIRSVDVKPCSATWFPRCPERRTGWCGRSHLWLQLAGGLSIADVAAMVPAEDLVPVQMPSGIYLTDRKSYARCKSFGYGNPLPPEPPRSPKTTPCHSPVHEREALAPPALPEPSDARGVPIIPWEGEPRLVSEVKKYRADLKGYRESLKRARNTPSRYPVRETPVLLCDTPGCISPGRPYAHGQRCDQHKPRPFRGTYGEA